MSIIYIILWCLAILATWYLAMVFVDYMIAKDLKMEESKARGYKHLKPLFSILPVMAILSSAVFVMFCVGMIIYLILKLLGAS